MKNFYTKFPETPGVYSMKDAFGKILYIGKAGNLRRRVSSYFQKAHDVRIEKLVSEIKKIDYKKTESALEALILEAALIKKYIPPYNIREKDDKSFLYVVVTQEEFPRVLLVRGKDRERAGKYFGPFVHAADIRAALRILRRIFPWHTHEGLARHEFKKPCFEYELGLCPGICVRKVSRAEYRTTIKNIILFLSGKKMRLIRVLEKDMARWSATLEFEKAEKMKKQLFALRHIQDVALLHDTHESLRASHAHTSLRIEGYDISNISGVFAVGVMVVFTDDMPEKKEYRKFKIRTLHGPNDVRMLQEVIARRLKNT